MFTKNTAAGLYIHTNADVLLSNSSNLCSNHVMTEAGFPGALDLKCTDLGVFVAFVNMTISHNNMSGIPYSRKLLRLITFALFAIF